MSNLTGELLTESTVAQGVVLVIDASGSMVGAPIEAAKTAAKSFVDQKRPEDFIALVTFSDEVAVLSEFSNRGTLLNERIDTIEAAGGTSMFDGIIRGTELFADADDDQIRKNMIVLTDGADENSVSDLAAASAAVSSAGIRTFGVALESEAFNPADLQQIVGAANGLFLSTSDPEELSSIYGQIRRELGNSLVLRFNVNQPVPADVEFQVSYGSFTAPAVTEAVPGFLIAPDATVPRTTTTVTYQQAAPIVIESELPASAGTLRWVGALGLGLTLGLVPVHSRFGTKRRGHRQLHQATGRIWPRWRRGDQEVAHRADSLCSVGSRRRLKRISANVGCWEPSTTRWNRATFL